MPSRYAPFIAIISLLFFSLSAFAQAPANDECADAITITLGTNTCGTPVNGTTQNATQSNTLPNPSCDYMGGGYNDDVWYKFTATRSGYVIFEFSNITGGDQYDYLSMSVDSGADCNNLMEVSCIQAVQNVAPLHVKQGTTYYLRLYSYFADPLEYKSFTFCAYMIDNDECSTARVLTVADIISKEVYAQIGTTDAATQSSTMPLPSCGGTGYNDDVWYKFTAGASGNMHVRIYGYSSISAQVYSGSCAGLAPLDCASGSAFYSFYINVNAIAGTDYFVRVFSTDPDPAVFNDFSITAYTLTPAPSNDECANAEVMTLGTISCPGESYGRTLGATASSNTPAPTCNASGTDDDIWFKFSSTNAGGVRVELRNYAEGNNSGFVAQLYSGDCNNLVPVSCNSFSGYNYGDHVAFQFSALPSTDYFIRVFTPENDPAKFAIVFACAFYLPPPPANDECDSAILIIPDTITQCTTSTNGTTIGANGSSNPGCYGVVVDDDVWYKFVAKATSQTITLTPAAVNGIQQYAAFQVFSGNCGSMTELNCVVANNPGAAAQNVMGGLTVGDTFYIRVYSFYNDYTNKGDFSICISTPNDECVTAETLTVNPSPNCTVETPGSTINATSSAAQFCTGNADDDVWYKFTATSSSHIIKVTPAATNGIDNVVFQVFAGDCSTLGQINCVNNTSGADAETVTASGLMAGNTYYIRVFSYDYYSGKGDFTVCITTTNDDCSNAVVIIPNNNADCSTVTSGTTIGATMSQYGCVGTADDDVWYSFIATHSTHKITVTPTVVNGIDNIVLEFFSGNCNSTGYLGCVNNTTAADPEERLLTRLTVGDNYFFRVHSYDNGVGNGDFTVCISSYNNDCNAALALAVNADENCTTTIHGNTVTTLASFAPCSGDADDALWYKFTATASTQKITVTPALTNGVSNVVLEVFNGSCPFPASLYCANNTTGAAAEEIIATGLTIGFDYYVAVYSFDNNAGNGEFDLCVATVTTPPANNECSGAIPLTVSSDPTCTNPESGTTFFATGTLNDCNDNSPIDDDVWYSFVALGSSQTIIVSSVYPNGLANPSMQFFSGSCGSLNYIACSRCPGCGGVGRTIPTIPGNTYYVAVYSSGNGSGNGDFSICATTFSPLNDDCVGAVNVPVNNDTTCTLTSSGTTVNATSSGRPSTCVAGTPDDDVWYKFVATSEAHVITVTPAATGGINDAVVEFYDGTCGGSLNSYGCSNGTTGNGIESLIVNTVIGTTYYVRVFSAAFNTSHQGAFTICIKNTVANDNCSGAITIPVNDDGTCTNTYQGTTAGSSVSQVPMCYDGSPRDVWYKFVANSTAYNIAVTPTVVGGIVNPRWDLLSGTCAATVSLGCASTTATFENLVIGNTYFMRVITPNNDQASQGAFTICIKSIPLANDICSAAINVPISNAEACITNVAGTTAGATVSQTSGNRDVWYKFTATEVAHKIKVSPALDSLKNVAFEVYSGSCGTLTSLAYVDVYNDPGYASPDSTKPEVQSIDGLIPGNTYYVRIFSAGVLRGPYAVEFPGSFTVCVSLSGNDACSGAAALTVNTDNLCTTTTAGTTVDATQSIYGCTGTADDDVWYKFVATATSQRFLVTAAASGGIQYPNAQIYSGSCGALTSLQCSGYFNFTSNTFGQGNLVVGNTYYVRVFSNGPSVAGRGAFTICVSTPNVTNDDCSNATALTVNADSLCTTTTTGSTVEATQSQAGCNGSADDDVWYKFVATAATQKIKVSAAASGGIQGPIVELLSGSCGSLNLVSCNSSVFVQPNLVVGSTYYIRVYSYGSTMADRGAFTICVSTPDVPNDNCAGAVSLPVNSNNLCTLSTNGTTVDATQSQAGCLGTADDDVWYKFIATATSHKISVNATVTGGVLYPVAELFSGTCSSLTSIQCNTYSGIGTNSFGQGNLIIGNTYYVRVYSNGSFASDEGAFTICVSTPNLPNDDCSNAIALTVNPDNLCAATTTGTTIEATQSQYGCFGTADDDVWYSFVATSTSHKLVVNSAASGGIQFPVVQIFSGTCSSLTAIQCVQPGSATNTTYIKSGLTPGVTYYLRISSASQLATDRGAFTICIGVPIIPANDNCAGAISLTVNPDNNCGATTAGTTMDATLSQIGCAGTADDDVWYSFIATSSLQNIVINSNAVNGIASPVAEVFSGTCGSLVSVRCNAASSPTNNSMTPDNLVPGNTYFLRVYSNSNINSSQGDFTICISVAPAGEMCENAIALTPSNDATANYLNGTTTGFIPTVANTTCNQAPFNDVWYKFTVTSTSNIIKVVPTQPNPTLYTTLYRGTCSAFTPVVCTTIDTAFSLPNLIVGEPILLRIQGFNQTTGNAFKIAVTTDVALNDECATAYALNIGANANTASQYHSTRGATQSQVACSGAAPANDVWYTVTAGTQPFAIEIDNLKINNINSQLFTGSCGTLTPVVCQTVDNIITVNNPTAGQTYYLRLYSSAGTVVGYFIKAYVKEALQKNTTIDASCLLANIAPNPGFENFSFCPANAVGVAAPGSAFIPGWSFPTSGTSDYYNSCSNFNTTVEIPRNCKGIQSPRAGKAYVGIVTYDGSGYREYLQAELAAPMVVGKRYLVSYYLNLGEMSQLVQNKLGVYFSTSKVSDATSGALTFIPQVVSSPGQFFNDKANWVNVSALITATQPWQYFVIGNFNNNANTTTISNLNGSFSTTNCGGLPISYLFIDDVSLSEVNETAVAAGCNGVLPLTLTHFDAIKKDKTALLSWKTVYEINTKHFEIERSIDGRNFYRIGTVAAGQNTGSSVSNYSHTDINPVIGKNFYRLKMIDMDGTFRYSEIRLVNFENGILYSVYPNPFNNNFTIVSNGKEGQYELMDAAGRTVLTGAVKKGTQVINTNNLASGLYIVYVEENGQRVFVQKIIKQ